jgi:hypothetical protein
MTESPPRHRDRPGATVHIGGERIPVDDDGRIAKVRRQGQIPGTEEDEPEVPDVVREAAEAWLAAVAAEASAKEDTKEALAALEHHMTDEKCMRLKIEDAKGQWWLVAVEGQTKIKKTKTEAPKKREGE